MLWVNLIMDSLGSLALTTESPYEELLIRKPNRRNESIINSKMLKHIILQGIGKLIILLVLFFKAPYFIKEHNIIRLAENQIIFKCYGRLPGFSEGESQYKLKHIIYGASIYWNSDIKLIVGSDEITCGKYSSKQDMLMAFKEYVNVNSSTAHMSIVFNIYALYTVFNQINSRVIDDEFNIFVRMNDNVLFPIIIVIELILQFVVMQYGNAAFKLIENGLTWQQWLISMGFGLITFVLSVGIKCVPLDKVIDLKLNKKDKVNEGLDVYGHELKEGLLINV